MGNKLNKIKFKKYSLKGFSLVELLLALAIFAVVVTANFGLAIDAYRSRANDRIRLEAGLVIKDTINTLYNYKNSSWSEIISNYDLDQSGSRSRKIDLIANKIQINFGSKSINNVTYEVYIKKAQRDSGVLVPNNESTGSDPDTIKVEIIASWTDIFSTTQQVSESYFFTNWSSTAWTEFNESTFTDGLVATPVFSNTEILSDNIHVAQKTPIANKDWCVMTENGTTDSYDLFTVGSGSVQSIATNSSNSGEVDYEVYEPTLSGPIPTNAPAPVAPSMPPINNSNPDICDNTGISISQCESLIRLYDETYDEDDPWTNSTNYWKASSNPCTWYGVSCNLGSVTAIDLSNNNLKGSIPNEIGNLTTVTSLNLSGNSLSGNLPPQLGKLTSLTTFDISGNDISGVIPKTLGNLSNMLYLDLSDNNIVGQIPSSIGRLTNLNELYLQDNSLTCHVPPQLANLTGIDLDIDGDLKLNFSNNNLLFPTSVSLLQTYFDSAKPENLTQNAVIDHEDCLYRPVSDDVYIAQHNTTEGDSSSSLYLEQFTSGSFPPDMNESILDILGEDLEGWENDINSDALQFDGIDDIAYVSNNPKWDIYDEKTIMAWVKSNDNSQTNYGRIIDFSNGSNNGWFLSFKEPNKLHFQHFATTPLEITDTNVITHQTWTHVSIVIADDVGTMYINGQDPISDSYLDLIPAESSQQLSFGNNTARSLGSDIELDEVRIYDRALTQNEIQKSYLTEIDRKDSGLVGYWRFNLSSLDQIFNDFSYQNAGGIRGQNISTDSTDPSIVPGIAKYRINDIYKYQNKLYLSTSNPSKDVIVFDMDNDTNTIMDFTIGTNGDSQGVAIDNFGRGYAIHGSYLTQFDSSNDVVGESQNLYINSVGIRNLIDLKLNVNKLYLLGLNHEQNFGVIDITSGITPTPVMKNLLMEAFL